MIGGVSATRTSSGVGSTSNIYIFIESKEMKCKDLIKIIQDLKLEDYEIFDISLDYTFKTGDISVGTNWKILPYPQYKDAFTFLEAESYDHIALVINMDDGSIRSKEENHYDTSTRDHYPY